ncbi:MAG: hypothetical protein QOE73_2669 [Verrucomicrobiota bacterium]
MILLNTSRAACLALFSAALIFVGSSAAFAATITVTSGGDSGAGTLRQAIFDAASGDTIDFASGLTITLTSAELLINKSLTISGPGANLLTVQRSTAGGTPNFRIVHIASGAFNVTISGLTISNGNTTAGGGGISNDGPSTVNVADCTISGNNASSGGGGGIENGVNNAMVTLTNSTVSGNTAFFGGGIFNNSTVTLTNSTLSGNMSSNSGGGIFNNGGTVTLTNSTLSGNTGGAGNNGGGGIFTGQGAVTLTNSTVSGNTSSGSGGGINAGSGTVTVKNTIIAGNTAVGSAPDLTSTGSFTSQGYNLIGKSDGSQGFTNCVNNDQVGSSATPLDPKLGPLQNNGGPTFTQALLTGSPAIDKGAAATDPVTSNPITTDQRGFTRPVDDSSIANATGGNGSDIGAFEAPACTPPPTGMVSWWPGDDNANDIQDGNDGTLQNGATFAPGKVGQAFSFDGVDDFVNVPDSPSLNQQTFTIDAWIKTGGITNGGVEGFIAAKSGTDASSGYEFGVETPAQGGHLRFALNGGAGGADFSGTISVTDNAFHHVAATYDGATMKLFVDGNLDAQKAVAVTISYPAGHPFVIDKREYPDAPSGTFPGLIDELEFFNRALSPTEIQAIVAAGSAGKCKPESHLANISTRAAVGTGDNVAIGGFIIRMDPTSSPASSTRGAAPNTKRVLIRGIGPSLTSNGVDPLPGRLMDPVIDLHDNNGALIASNDDWKVSDGTQTEADITNTGLAPSDDHESALLRTLASDNAYTAILLGAGNTTGIGLVEVYDLESRTDVHFANISTRGFVSTGDDVLIGGIILQGGNPQRILLRAIGPSLAAHGISNALEDPVLELHDSNGAVMETNDDWMNSPEKTCIIETGLAPSDPKESAILFTLAPGGYTAIVHGKDPNPTGIGLVEAYDLGQP